MGIPDVRSLNCTWEGIRPMNSGITLLPKIWHWYYGFLLSMGGVFAGATALAVGVLLTHWLYLCSRRIEPKPTPSSNVNMITGSTLTPLRESVTALPAFKAEDPADLPARLGTW